MFCVYAGDKNFLSVSRAPVFAVPFSALSNVIFAHLIKSQIKYNVYDYLLNSQI